jgi:hypothetical protein
MRVLGATADCSCVVAGGELPTSIRPSETKVFTISVRLPPSAGLDDVPVGHGSGRRPDLNRAANSVPDTWVSQTWGSPDFFFQNFAW